jgi:hypothetical protein
MKETQIEKLRQIISRTDKSGNEKVDLLLSLFREHSAKILEPLIHGTIYTRKK